MDKSIAEIAGKLSEAQRDWVLAMPTIPTSLSPEQWDAMPPLYVQMEPDEYELGYHYPVYYGRKEWLGSAQADKPVGTEWYLSAQLNETGLALRKHLNGE